MAVFTRTEATNPGSGLWFEVIQFVLQGAPSATSFTLLNVDGTLTEVAGIGFEFVGGVPTGGTIQSMTQVPSPGGAVIRTLTGLDHSLVAAFNAGAALGEFFLSGDDDIFGNSRGNNLFGFGGDDLINGRAGVDVIDGGEGFDIVSYGGATSSVSVDLQAQHAWDGTSMDFFVSIEGASGTNLSDFFVGSAGDNVFNGMGGVDFINGAGGSDMVSYRTGFTSGVYVDLAGQIAWDGTSMDFLTSIEEVRGSHQSDILQGSIGNNEFEGLGGVDFINGLGGSDTLRFTYHATAVSIDLANQWTWDGTSMDFLTSIENASGSALNDTIFGSAGNNIIGGYLGDDVLIGNGGNDTFQYRGLGRGNDTVVDFDTDPVGGQDVIDIVGRGLTAADIGTGILLTALATDITLITFASDGTTVRLLGVASTTIDGSDFLF